MRDMHDMHARMHVMAHMHGMIFTHAMHGAPSMHVTRAGMHATHVTPSVYARHVTHGMHAMHALHVMHASHTKYAMHACQHYQREKKMSTPVPRQLSSQVFLHNLQC